MMRGVDDVVETWRCGMMMMRRCCRCGRASDEVRVVGLSWGSSQRRGWRLRGGGGGAVV
ncbi:hypothetical protein Tco_1579643, partial [Tanacetum coccineum]